MRNTVLGLGWVRGQGRVGGVHSVLSAWGVRGGQPPAHMCHRRFFRCERIKNTIFSIKTGTTPAQLSLPATPTMLIIKPLHSYLYQQRPQCSSSSTVGSRYRLGNGAATRAARRPDERGCSAGGSSTSKVKLTPRSSDELITKPPATHGLRNRSLRPDPYRTHSSVTDVMVTPEMGAGC